MNIFEQQCQDCLCIFLNPSYSEFGFETLFSEASFSYGSTEGRADEQISWLNERGLIKDECSVLDVGCYEGDFLSKLPKKVKKTGIDINEPAIIRGQKKHAGKGINFIQCDFECFNNEEPVDTIVMFHVLEHLPRPVAVLKNLKLISKINTRLVIEVPIIEKGLTNDICGFFSVGHLTHFSENSLNNCLEKSGWRLLEGYMIEGYNGYRVIAEPTRDLLTTKIAINIEDKLRVFKYFAHWYDSLSIINNHLKSHESNNLIIWGGGWHTEFLYHFSILFLDENKRFIIVDSDQEKQGKTWRGVLIYDPLIINGMNWSANKLLISTYQSQNIICDIAVSMGVPRDKIIKIYDYINVC